MRKVAVPAPPQASFEEKRAPRKAFNPAQVVASRRISPLDAAFLQRVYRFVPRFGALLTLSVAVMARNVALPLSLAAGILTGLLLLKTQEMFVRRVLRPKSEGAYDGADEKVPAWAIVPGKYALVIATLWLMRRTELLHYAGFAAGCTVTQLIVLSMAWRRLKANVAGGRTRSINEIYVQPHKIKKFHA